jgi:DNA-binding transcriptional LysR family regulator
MINLRGVDLNLLVVFEAVYEERVQAKAAQRLAMTQPAVSSAMARLRVVVGQEIFVPALRGVVPTRYADRLYGEVKSALSGLREALSDEIGFDPTTSERRFSVGVSYAAGALAAPVALEALRSEAPGIEVSLHMIEDLDDLAGSLADGALDLAVDYVRCPGKEILQKEILVDRLVLIAARSHPRVGRTISMKALLDEKHVILRESAARARVSPLTAAMVGSAFTLGLEVSNALAIPAIVSRSEMVAIVTARVARFFKEPLGLRIVELPFRAPRVPMFMHWHRTRKRDAGHGWFREAMTRVSKIRTI